MKIILYTLPSCPICHMVKTKLKNKNIDFQEKDFAEISAQINSVQAPALQVTDEQGNIVIYNSPSQMVAWISQYGE